MMHDRSPLSEPPRERVTKWVVAVILAVIALVPWAAILPAEFVQQVDLTRTR